MANDLDGFFNSMSAAFTEANKVLRPQAAFLTGDNGMPIIYTDVRSTPLSRYKQVTLNVPNSTVVVNNILTDAINIHDLDHTPTVVSMNLLYGAGFELGPLDEIQAADPEGMRRLYVDETVKAVIRKANGYIASLVNTTNFAVAGNVTGTSLAGVSLNDFTQMNGVLASRDVDVEDAGNLFFLANSLTYTGLLKDTAWREAAKVGDQRATNQMRSGVLPITYGAIPLRENQMPASTVSTTTTSKSIYFHRHAMAMVTAPLNPPPATVAYIYESFGPLTFLIAVGYNQDTTETKLTIHTLLGVVPWKTTHGVIHTGTLTALA